MSKFTNPIKIVVCAAFILTGTQACQHYFKAIPQNSSTSERKAQLTDSLNAQKRYFILREGEKAYSMQEITLNADKTSMQFKTASLDNSHRLYVIGGRKGKMKYNKNDMQDARVLNEVHFYIEPGNNVIENGLNTLSLDKVQKIEVIEKDKKRTTNSYVIGAVGITLSAILVVAIIVAATKSSCPFVSAYDGEQFTLQGEIYGGAIYPQLARHDYLPLAMKPLPDGTLSLKISNELEERQFTDLADLWVITHNNNSRVYADEFGNLSEITHPIAPISCTLNGRSASGAALTEAGDNALLYMDDTSSADARNDLVMMFEKPVNATEGRLLLNLKNAYFLDLLYGELAKGFGTYYNTYVSQQKNKPAAELRKWIAEQQIPLTISIKKDNEWQKITELSTVGPLATRNMVIPISLTGTTGSKIEIKLSSGFMFWEFDQLAMDFSTSNDFTIEKLRPVSATDENNLDVLSQLKNEDDNYLAQPDIGNTATISFKQNIQPVPGKMQTYILHSKGYYEHKRNFKNKPNISFLNQFKKPNALSLYGLEVYKKMDKDRLSNITRHN